MQEALEKAEVHKEQKAIGTVRGEDVVVDKTSYRTKSQHKFWKVMSRVGGHTARVTQLDPGEAEDVFDNLVETYDLEVMK